MKIKIYLFLLCFFAVNTSLAKNSLELGFNQAGWNWAKLGNYNLSGVDIKIYRINNDSNAVQLTQKVFEQFADIFAYIQFTKDSYVLGGALDGKNYMAQVFSVTNNTAVAYVSVLSERNLKPLEIVNFPAVKSDKTFDFTDLTDDKRIYGLSTKMSLKQSYSYISFELEKNNQKIKNTYIGDKQFFVETILNNNELMHIYAYEKANKTIITIKSGRAE